MGLDNFVNMIGSEINYVSMGRLVKISLKKKLPEGEFKLEIYVKDRYGNKHYYSSIYNKYSNKTIN